MTEPLNIYLFIEDFDNNELSEYERIEQLEEAVRDYNDQYCTAYIPQSTVRRYLRLQKWSDNERQN